MKTFLVRMLSVFFGCVTLGAAISESPAAEPNVGFLIADRPGEVLGPECDSACELARRLTAATILRPAGGGKFVDSAGRELPLDRLSVVWCHEDEPSRHARCPWDEQTVEALRRLVRAGRGLLLSGAAASLVGPLGVDTARTEPLTFGNDRGQAGLIPLASRHPAFRAVDLDRNVLWMSNAVFPAFAQFHPASKPARGMILAVTPGGLENPLVEYPLGQGRVIVLAWRLDKLYADADAAYRDNFERLARNLVEYLGDAKTWQPLAMTADGRPLAAAPSPAVPEDQWRALELAIRDLSETLGDRYPRGADYLKRMADLKRVQESNAAADCGKLGEAARRALAETARRFDELRTEALLANPLLDFSRLLLVKRGANQLGLPQNFLSNSSLPQAGYDNQIAVLSPVRPDGKLTTLFKPGGGRFVGDVDLHFDADRLLFSMPAANGRWRVFEIRADGLEAVSTPRQFPLIEQPDVDDYDACYLPDGRIIFCSTACFTGVPCVGGSGHVCNLYLLGPGGKIRQLTLEQDHDWCPTVLNNGRILYLRWEYTDLPHAFSRILFHMNPDGTQQMEYYGSNSYWPASMFYARPIPGHPTKVVAVVGGHHELPRMGDLVIFDPARGRFEADGAVQRIPGYGRRPAPTMLDLPIAQTWPKFLHPFPLSEKYFLVSAKPSADVPWGIYLVDVFDNMTLVYQEPGYAMFEPIPLRKTPRPPVIPDAVDLGRKDAEVFLADVYRGAGLLGVPRGTIKSLRVISYQFAYQGMGAEPYSVGLDGPWDPKLVLGTVPVFEDGSAHFRVPATTPIALQPLDAEGKAVQLMRSWFTAMPGEVVSCVGCHEKQNTVPPVRDSIAASRPPAEIKPWYGPARGFSFRREVQPVLDKYCTGCHDGKPRPDGRQIPNLTDGPNVATLDNRNYINVCSRFSPSYYQLRRFVRTPTKESDMHVLTPWDYHADTTRLVQMLQKGHYNVTLDAEAWDRLVTWIDLNAPAHGNWTDICGDQLGPQIQRQRERRRQMRKLYAGMDDDPESPCAPAALAAPVAPTPLPPAAVARIDCPGWPFDAGEAARRQREPGGPVGVSIPLAPGVALDLVRIPAGEFVMGQADGWLDERPPGRVKIDAPFWIGRCEVSNEQFAQFDPSHRSRIESADFIQFSPGERGWTLSRPKQPVVRVSWHQAAAFCRWLGEKTGRPFTLPTEAQWEYACRAGTATPLWYGTLDDDFSTAANVSDLSHQAIDPFGWPGRSETLPPWRPADTRYNDKNRVSAAVGSYRPNPWGLFDMHGNVAEWTRSEYRPYPYDDRDGRNSPGGGKKVVRGGSWYDRPDRCRSAFRQAYRADQPVYDVGFRVVCEQSSGLAGLVERSKQGE